MPKISRTGGPSYAPGREPPGTAGDEHEAALEQEAAEDEQEPAAPAPPPPSPRPVPRLTDRAPGG